MLNAETLLVWGQFVDKYLRRLKRLATNDPSLKDQYTHALERAIGVGDEENCKGMEFTSDGRLLLINSINISNPNDGLIVGHHSYGEYGNSAPMEFNKKTLWEKELAEWSEKYSSLKPQTANWVPPGQDEPLLPEAVGPGYKLIDPIVPEAARNWPLHNRMQIDTILEYHTGCCWFYSRLRLVFFPTFDELKLSPQYLIEREMEKLNWYEVAMEIACD